MSTRKALDDAALEKYVFNDLRHLTIVDTRHPYLQDRELYTPNKIFIKLDKGRGDLTKILFTMKLEGWYLYDLMLSKFRGGDKSQSTRFFADFSLEMQTLQRLWLDLDTINDTIEVESMSLAIYDAKFIQDFGIKLLAIRKAIAMKEMVKELEDIVKERDETIKRLETELSKKPSPLETDSKIIDT